MRRFIAQTTLRGCSWAVVVEGRAERVRPTNVSMESDSPSTSTLRAKLAAQRLAFGPLVFQAVRLLQKKGVLEHLVTQRKQGASVQEIVQATGLSHYGATVLLEGGLAAEVVEEREGRYYLTRVGFFVERDELTRVNMDFTHDVCYEGMFRLEQAIDEGRPAGLDVFGQWPTIYEALSELPAHVRESWFAFDHFYSDHAFPEALPLVFARKPQRIVDIGGNTGRFAIACCRFDPAVQVTIVDLPGQIADAARNVAAAGVDDRVLGHPLNLLDPAAAFPSNGDVLWMSQFLSCFSEHGVVSLLRRGREALRGDARLFIQDTFWDAQRYDISTYCLQVSSLYFTAVANGNSRMYRLENMRAFVAQAGLDIVHEHHNVGIGHTLLECRATQ